MLTLVIVIVMRVVTHSRNCRKALGVAAGASGLHDPIVIIFIKSFVLYNVSSYQAVAQFLIVLRGFNLADPSAPPFSPLSMGLAGWEPLRILVSNRPKKSRKARPRAV
jgi:hypothetical protein